MSLRRIETKSSLLIPEPGVFCVVKSHRGRVTNVTTVAGKDFYNKGVSKSDTKPQTPGGFLDDSSI